MALGVIVVVGVLNFGRPMPQPQFTHQAFVQSETVQLQAQVQFSEAGDSFDLTLTAAQPNPNRDFEMWFIPEGATVPISLGVIRAEQEVQTFQLPPPLSGQLNNAVFAISDEPKGGSPTGTPTGDIIAVAKIEAL
ncbi:MAG: anti-sigma factor domain-containing protein [Planktomarina sp.]